MGLLQKRLMKGVFAILNDDDNEDFFAVNIAQVVAASTVCFQKQEPKRQGSLTGKSANHFRDRAAGHKRLLQDYFLPEATYESRSRRRFRMRRQLFEKILADIEKHDSYFVQTSDALGVLGLSSMEKVIAALRMFTYGISADGVDEYVRIGESTAMKCFKRFCNCSERDLWCRVSSSAYRGGGQQVHGNQRDKRISRNVRIAGLYALDMEKLPCSLAISL